MCRQKKNPRHRDRISPASGKTADFDRLFSTAFTRHCIILSRGRCVKYAVFRTSNYVNPFVIRTYVPRFRNRNSVRRRGRRFDRTGKKKYLSFFPPYRPPYIRETGEYITYIMLFYAVRFLKIYNAHINSQTSVEKDTLRLVFVNNVPATRNFRFRAKPSVSQ